MNYPNKSKVVFDKGDPLVVLEVFSYFTESVKITNLKIINLIVKSQLSIVDVISQKIDKIFNIDEWVNGWFKNLT